MVTCLPPPQALHAGTPMWGSALPWVFLDPKQMCVEDPGMSFGLLSLLTDGIMIVSPIICSVMMEHEEIVDCSLAASQR